MQSKASVASFEYEWNYFGFSFAKEGWQKGIAIPLAGGEHFFKGKTVVDAGAGSGAQSLWMAEAGASSVVSLELSDAVFGRHRKTIAEFVDRIRPLQCDIAFPPLRTTFDIVYCINVLQHTARPRETFSALARLVKPDGVFLFNVYTRRSESKFKLVKVVRRVIRPLPFPIWRLAALLLTCFGYPASKIPFLKRRITVVLPISHSFRETWLDTYDAFGGHWYQENMTVEEQRRMIAEEGFRIERETQFGYRVRRSDSRSPGESSL
jgi:SAM-dependent methyltransferase